jgi:hypothetical protein
VPSVDCQKVKTRPRKQTAWNMLQLSCASLITTGRYKIPWHLCRYAILFIADWSEHGTLYLLKQSEHFCIWYFVPSILKVYQTSKRVHIPRIVVTSRQFVSKRLLHCQSGFAPT